jgi:LysM repeat protein
MRSSILGTVAALALAVPATAAAQFPHVVAPGESLSSIAAADGLTVAQVAAENGLSPDAQLVAGSTVLIPPQETATATAGAPSAGARSSIGSPADEEAAEGETAVATTSTGTATAGGSYVVQPGDTLSAIAARAGTSVAELAAANGLDPNGVLLAGHALSLSGAGSGTAEPVSTTVATSQSSVAGVSGGPYPTPQTLDAGTVGSVGASAGAPSSLTQAVGWNESGFNNDLVSSTGAVGVMQIEPYTWSYINQILTPGAPLDPYSATDNVRAGALYLHHLIAETGSYSLAVAAYNEGLGALRTHGIYSETQQYVNNVMASQAQFGGGG